jgi:hypothetical protein
MTTKVVRLLSLLTFGLALYFLAPSPVQIVHANGDCECSGYTYAFDYVPVYYTYEGEQSWGGSDPNSPDDSYCLSGCLNYAVYTIGAALCNTYSLGGGKGFVEPSFTWSFYDGGLYGGSYYNVQYAC